MKILLTTPTYNPKIDGLSNAAKRLSELFVQLGHQVFVASYINALSDNEKIKCHGFNVSGSLTLRSKISGAIEEYLEWIIEQKFDIIILNAWHCWSTELVLMNKSRINSKIILISHGTASAIYYDKKPFYSLRRFINYLPFYYNRNKLELSVDTYVFLADGGEKSRFVDVRRAKRLGFEYYIIPNLPPSDIDPVPPKQIVEHDPKIKYLAVGTYDWEKGFERVLLAYAKSSSKNIDYLEFVGPKKTKYSSKLIELVEKYDIEERYIKFSFGLSRCEILRRYQKCDVLLNGSYTECQSLVILDALMLSLPFVSFGTGDSNRLSSGLTVSTVNEFSHAMNLIRKSNYRNYLARRSILDRSRNDREFISSTWKQILK